jgi:hypothetical protein
MVADGIAGAERELEDALHQLGHALICEARSRQGTELASLLTRSLAANRESKLSDDETKNDIRNA